MNSAKLCNCTKTFITARKRSLGQGNVLSSVCQGFCPRGGRAWRGGVCVAGGHAWWGVCMVGVCAWWGGHVWQGVGGMCGRGGMHGGRHAWWGGACMAGGRAWQILRDTVNERAVRILLECILV